MSTVQAGVIQFEFDEDDLRDEDNLIAVLESPPKTIARLSWQIRLVGHRASEQGDLYKLGAFVICRNEGARTYWRCDHYTTLKLIGRRDDSKTRTFKTWSPFYENSICRGTSELIKWKKQDDNSQFHFLDLTNYKFLLEAHIHVTGTMGVRSGIAVNDFSAENEASDACLVVENKKVYVSKPILFFHSPVFKAMFTLEFKEKHQSEVEIGEVQHKDFIDFLNVLHGNAREITDDSIEAILELADRFQAKTVIEAAEDFLISTSSISVAKKLLISEQYKLQLLQGFCLHSFKTVEALIALERDELYLDFTPNLKKGVCDRLMAFQD